MDPDMFIYIHVCQYAQVILAVCLYRVSFHVWVPSRYLMLRMEFWLRAARFVYVCIHTRLYTRIYMLECIHIDMCMCISIRVCIYVHTYAVYVCFHAYMYMYPTNLHAYFFGLAFFHCRGEERMYIRVCATICIWKCGDIHNEVSCKMISMYWWWQT